MSVTIRSIAGSALWTDPFVGAAGQRRHAALAPLNPFKHLGVAEREHCDFLLGRPPRSAAVIVGVALRRRLDRGIPREGEAQLCSRWRPVEPRMIEPEEP